MKPHLQKGQRRETHSNPQFIPRMPGRDDPRTHTKPERVLQKEATTTRKGSGVLRRVHKTHSAHTVWSLQHLPGEMQALMSNSESSFKG